MNAVDLVIYPGLLNAVRLLIFYLFSGCIASGDLSTTLLILPCLFALTTESPYLVFHFIYCTFQLKTLI